VSSGGIIWNVAPAFVASLRVRRSAFRFPPSRQKSGKLIIASSPSLNSVARGRCISQLLRADLVEHWPSAVLVGRLPKPPRKLCALALGAEGITSAIQLRPATPYMIMLRPVSLKSSALSPRSARFAIVTGESAAIRAAISAQLPRGGGGGGGERGEGGGGGGGEGGVSELPAGEGKIRLGLRVAELSRQGKQQQRAQGHRSSRATTSAHHRVH